MNKSIQTLEEAIDRMEKRFPGVPRQEVMLTRLILHLNQRMCCYLNEALKPWGINETVWMSLLALYAAPGSAVNPSELSDMLDSSRTNATRISDEMVRQGWAERIACPDDRRKIELRMTPAGTALVEDLLPVSRKAQMRLWECFDEEQKHHLEKTLRTLFASLGG